MPTRRSPLFARITRFGSRREKERSASKTFARSPISRLHNVSHLNPNTEIPLAKRILSPWRHRSITARLANMKWIYKIAYPTAKTYIGKDN
jgi:hypothetical protein